MFSCNVWWGSRTPDKRSETIPSSRITPDPLDSQIHDGASSLQLTHVLQGSGQRTHLLQGSGQRTGMAVAEVLCSVTHFCVDFQVCVWIIARLEDPNTVIRFLTESVTYWFVYLLVFDQIYDVSKQDVQDLQQKYRPTTSKIQQYISLYTWGTFYPCVH